MAASQNRGNIRQTRWTHGVHEAQSGFRILENKNGRKLQGDDDVRNTFDSISFWSNAFALTNALAIFRRMMDKILHRMPSLRVYLDYLAVLSKTIDEHFQHLERIFVLLGKHSLQSKLSNCEFLKNSVEPLVHIVGFKEILFDPGNVAAKRDTAVPRDATPLGSFLGYKAVHESLCLSALMKCNSHLKS